MTRIVDDAAPVPSPPRTRGRTDRARRTHPVLTRLAAVAKGAAGLIAVALLWELGRATGLLPQQWVPSVVDIVVAWWTALTTGVWFTVLADTVYSWLLGLLGATVIGVVWGIAIGINPLVSASSRIVVRLMRPIPSVALIPVAILALGTGPNMVLALAVFASIWPILFNTLYAVRDIPEQYYDVARTLGHRKGAVLLRVTSVAVLPGVLTGIRVASGIALVVTVSAELVTGTAGLGGHILQMRTAVRLPDAYASVLMGGLLGVIMSAVILWLQRRFLSWSPDNRRMER